MPVVGRQQKNLCTCRTYVPVAGGQQKNQSLREVNSTEVHLLPFKNIGEQMRKEKAIKIISDCAKDYSTYLENQNLMFIFGDCDKPCFFETVFLPRNFLHLTGIKLKNKESSGSSDFYKKALKGQLSSDDFSVSRDGTTEMKLTVLPQLMKIHTSAKMVGDYDFTKSVLYTEKIAGNIHACLGFAYDSKCNYYIPNTALREDIRNITAKPQQRILAILKKHISQSVYSEICYTAKKVDFDDIKIPTEISDKIDISNKI